MRYWSNIHENVNCSDQIQRRDARAIQISLLTVYFAAKTNMIWESRWNKRPSFVKLLSVLVQLIFPTTPSSRLTSSFAGLDNGSSVLEYHSWVWIASLYLKFESSRKCRVPASWMCCGFVHAAPSVQLPLQPGCDATVLWVFYIPHQQFVYMQRV